MSDKYEGLSAGAAFELHTADEQFQQDAAKAAENAKPLQETRHKQFLEQLRSFDDEQPEQPKGETHLEL